MNSTLTELRSTPLLARCQPADLRRFRREADYARVTAKSTISPPGPLHFFYLLLTGRATLITQHGTTSLGPGDSYGATQMLTPHRTGELLVAGTDVGVLVIHRRRFLGLLDTVPTFAGALAQQLAAAQVHTCHGGAHDATGQ